MAKNENPPSFEAEISGVSQPFCQNFGEVETRLPPRVRPAQKRWDSSPYSFQFPPPKEHFEIWPKIEIWQSVLEPGSFSRSGPRLTRAVAVRVGQSRRVEPGAAGAVEGEGAGEDGCAGPHPEGRKGPRPHHPIRRVRQAAAPHHDVPGQPPPATPTPPTVNTRPAMIIEAVC